MESSVIHHMARLPNMVNGKFLASPRCSDGGNFPDRGFDGRIAHVEPSAKRNGR
jgi:hypothetical protein